MRFLWLQTIAENLVTVTVLEARRLEEGVRWAMLPPKATGEDPACLSQLLVAQASLACGHTPNPAPSSLGFFPPCAWVCFSFSLS